MYPIMYGELLLIQGQRIPHNQLIQIKNGYKRNVVIKLCTNGMSSHFPMIPFIAN